MPLLLILAASCLVSSMSMRVLEPVVPAVARDLAVSPELIALATTAFAVPYALGQLLLGPLGDAFGKARVIKISLAVLAVCLALSAFAVSAEMLFAARIMAGLAGGGIIPLAFAMIGDRFALEVRQIAMSRILSAILLGQIMGSTGSGLLASFTSWRTVQGVAALLAIGALVLTVWRLTGRNNAAQPKTGSLSFAGMLATYKSVFANPNAPVCFAAVAVEGIVIFGLLPYLAVLLEERGAGSVREAGFVLAGLAAGGFLYTWIVPTILPRIGLYNLIRYGGVLAGIGFLGIASAGSWPLEMAAFVFVGLGFYMMHNSLQTQATELAPSSRGAGVALHAFFMFSGQAVGPIVYSIAFNVLHPFATISIAGCCLAGLGFVTATALQARSQQKASSESALPSSWAGSD